MISKVVHWFLSEHVVAKARAIGIGIGILIAIVGTMIKCHAFVMMDIIEFGHPLDMELIEPDRMMYDWHDRHNSPYDRSDEKERDRGYSEKESVMTDSNMGYS